ncbi:MAG: hypothetical protein H0X71_08240 [Rubrobacter sp.]|nr:hypothetical protein [Rubrobacter sp.]
MLRKFVIVAALLTMLLTASAPLVLAQRGQDAVEEHSESDMVPVDYIVDCYFIAPATACPADEDGFVTLPDGIAVPVEEFTDDPVVEQSTGNLVQFVDGEPVVVEYAQFRPQPGPDIVVNGASVMQYSSE